MSDPMQASQVEGQPVRLGDSVYQRLLKERIIWLGGEVMDDSANAICAQLLLLAAENPDEDIYLYINSPDGHHIRFHVLHRVVNSHPSSNGTTGAVNI